MSSMVTRESPLCLCAGQPEARSVTIVTVAQGELVKEGPCQAGFWGLHLASQNQQTLTFTYFSELKVFR